MIKVRGLSKNFTTAEGPVHAVHNITFEVPKGEFYTLLGPSGCGKSTTLRCIAGLDQPDGGEIFIDDVMVVSPQINIPPNKRDISMVFQSYAIWPHLTVFKNVEFPLKQIKPKPSKAARRERVMEALSLVRMDGLANRPTPNLSGGQQQRVALARALVCNPKVMLLDEPLSNLDAKLREELRLEIKDLVARLGITSIYVTHDQEEALVISDRISVMLNGEIVQEATPKELYLWPDNLFVAQFIGKINVFGGTVGEMEGNGMGVITNPHARFLCSLPPGLEKGDRATVAIRPQCFTISKRKEAELNSVEGTVKRSLFAGDYIHCEVAWGGNSLLYIQLLPTVDIREGDTVFLRADSQFCRVFPGDAVKS